MRVETQVEVRNGRKRETSTINLLLMFIAIYLKEFSQGLII